MLLHNLVFTWCCHPLYISFETSNGILKQRLAFENWSIDAGYQYFRTYILYSHTPQDNSLVWFEACDRSIQTYGDFLSLSHVRHGFKFSETLLSISGLRKLDVISLWRAIMNTRDPKRKQRSPGCRGFLRFGINFPKIWSIPIIKYQLFSKDIEASIMQLSIEGD